MKLLCSDIVLCHQNEAKYMEEYLRIIAQGVAAIHLWTPHQRPYTDTTAKYVCVRRIPLHLLPPSAIVYFVNTEQLTVPAKLKEFRKFIADAAHLRLTVFDYSAHNVGIAATLGIASHHLPVGENVKETNKLRLLMLAPKEFDIAVVGSISPHREAVVNGLRACGLRVDFITDCWGDARDARIGQCALLLNVHYNHSYQLYEPIRCNRWQYADMPIVTEPCVDGAPPDVYVHDVTNVPVLASFLRNLLASCKR